jgi:glycosyltransferase involved in cell wall biosynthesis
MRLLSITHYSSLLGANRSLLHLLEALRDLYGVEVLVFCPQHGPFTEALAQKGIPCVVKPFANWGYSLRSKGLYLFPFVWPRAQKKIVPELVEAARTFAPDVVHSNSSLVALGWQISEAIGKPHVWHLREFGWADYQVVFPLGHAFLRQKLAAAASVVCISEAIRKSVAGEIPAEVLFNGIGNQERIKKMYVAGQQTGSSETGACRFFIIGMLHPNKGQHEALRAFASVHRRHPKARLIVAGAGRRLYALRLKWMAWWLGIADAVEFTGYVANPAALYAQSDVVLMCSRQEGMGRVTAEAMAYGKPVIGRNSGATPELVQHEWNGLLYDSTQALAEAMALLTTDPPKRKILGENAYRFAQDSFSDEDYSSRFWSILEKVVGRNSVTKDE